MNSEAKVVDGLGSGLFPNHPKSGPWETLKGRMLNPLEADVLTSTNTMNAHGQTGSTVTQDWNETVVVNTGLTGGGGAMAE